MHAELKREEEATGATREALSELVQSVRELLITEYLIEQDAAKKKEGSNDNS